MADSHSNSRLLLLTLSCMQDGLRCFKREPDETNNVPYCSGGETDKPGKNYCTRRDKAPISPRISKVWLSKVAEKLDENGGIRDDGNSVDLFPLQLCEGDCNENDDCAVRTSIHFSFSLESLFLNLWIIFYLHTRAL